MNRKIKFEGPITLEGPFESCSLPFGFGRPTLYRENWFVTRPLPPKERKTPCQKITGSKGLGSIVRLDGKPKRFVINDLHPVKAFDSLKKAVDFLVKNEGKIVFCS
jgi:hypothetical protein